MSAQRASPGEPLPGWSTSRAAQAAYGKHLVRIGRLLPALLYAQAMDRQYLTAAHTARRQDLIDSQVSSPALECRETCWRPRSSWTRSHCATDTAATFRAPTTRDSHKPVPRDVELRTDASDVAGELAGHDRQHGTSTTGDIPLPPEDGCTDAERDAVRAYARREWGASRERWPGT